MEARQKKIGLLSRANRGKKAVPVVIAGLSQALGYQLEEPSFASLEKTDELAKLSWQRYSSSCGETDKLSYRRIFTIEEEERVFQLASCVADVLKHENAWILLTRFAEVCGAVSIDLTDVLAHARNVISFDQNSICAISHDEREGLLFDHNPDDVEQAFEFVVWGDRWPLIFSAAINLLRRHKVVVEQQRIPPRKESRRDLLLLNKRRSDKATCWRGRGG